ncbi:NYN domain-containing protein [Nocardia asiatica]|uniref:NYN domain-containing protein n=1 Tax=Nocardia asiatica TaxID=209252 RepID=UPI0024541DCF|nr:NYN domain-containing protein [Nocardia asiatica]
MVTEVAKQFVRLRSTTGRHRNGHETHTNYADCRSRPTTRPEIAILIDAENIPAARIGEVLTRAGDYGSRQIRRAFGDWRRPSLAAWQHSLLAYAIRPVQQFSWTTGKNASDLALAIDAMDLLASGIRRFALVSSDSDFTGLALRLRESGCDVYGFGEDKTPRSFVTACTAFISLQDLSHNAPIQPCPAAETSHHPPPEHKAGIRTATDACVSSISAEQIRRLCALVKKAARDDGWTDQATVGHLITRELPELRNLIPVPVKLGQFLAATGLFDIQHRTSPGGKPPKIYIRNKIRQ